MGDNAHFTNGQNMYNRFTKIIPINAKNEYLQNLILI